MASPQIVITYCPACHWLARATWMAQEFLQTFTTELAEVVLRTGDSGTFSVELDGEVIFDRASEGGFAEITEIKRRIRDRVAPDRSLGHADRQR